MWELTVIQVYAYMHVGGEVSYNVSDFHHLSLVLHPGISACCTVKWADTAGESEPDIVTVHRPLHINFVLHNPCVCYLTQQCLETMGIAKCVEFEFEVIHWQCSTVLPLHQDQQVYFVSLTHFCTARLFAADAASHPSYSRLFLCIAENVATFCESMDS